MTSRLAVTLVSCHLFLASPAIAQILPPGEEPPPAGGGGGGQTASLQPITPAAIGQILQDAFGLKSEVTRTGAEPMLLIRNWREYNVNIILRDCKDQVCQSFFMLVWGKAPAFMTLKWMNRWHQKWAYARIRLDDKKNFLFDMYVNCRGGVTRDNIIANLKMYETQLGNLSGPR